MAHYVCTGGCGGVSDVPGTCNAHDCIKYHQPLTFCNCKDEAHMEAFEHPNKATEPETSKE